MPIVPLFSAGQNYSNPNTIVLQDNSTGSDVAVTKRRIYLTDSQGTAVVPTGTYTAYIDWALVTNPISLNVLTRDKALTVRVEWLDISNTVLYTVSTNFCFDAYSKNFLYYLVQLQGITPLIPSDSNYNMNLGIFWANILGAANAITVGNDTAAAQNCLNRCYQMQQQKSKYF